MSEAVTQLTQTGGIDITAIRDEAELLAFEPELPSQFTIKRASAWIDSAKNKPVPNKLFQEFWYESEVCFLFADANIGKSILAVQIADRISRGESGAPAQTVLYFDFELAEKQFEARYSENYQNHYEFHEHFYRVEMDIDAEQPERFQSQDDWLNYSFEMAIVETEAKIVIVDNITYLRDETDKGHIAARLMKMLKKLKTKYDLSILVLAHTPKRDLTKPLTRNDLGGSKMLINFCDSCFAVGESMKDKSLRYLKQIKVRNGEFKYDSENVLLCRIEKETNFLEMQPVDFVNEQEHLKKLTDKERDEMHDRIRALSYLPQREIAIKVGVSVGTVNRYLKMDSDERSNE